jgi:hypothetical protein
VSGISPANLSTLSAHIICDSSSSAPTLAATLFPKSLIFNTVSSSKACFSAVVFSVMALIGQQSSNVSLAALNDALSAFWSVMNHAAAGDFDLRESSRKQTLYVSVSPVFMRMILSNLFIKSCGSWSSGFPVNEQLDMSAMFTLSRSVLYTGGGVAGVIGRVFWLLSSGVHVAGENVNWEDSEDSVKVDESSSESGSGVVLFVLGMKRSCRSRSMVPMDWRGASLAQDVSFVN